MASVTYAQMFHADSTILDCFLEVDASKPQVEQQQAMVDRLGALDAVGQYDWNSFSSHRVQLRKETMEPMTEAAHCGWVVAHIPPLRNALRALYLANDYPAAQCAVAFAALLFGRRVQGLFQGNFDGAKTGEMCYDHVRPFFATYNDFAYSVSVAPDDSLDFGYVKDSVHSLIQDLDWLKTNLARVAIDLGRPVPENVRLIELAGKSAETATVVRIGHDMMSAKISDCAAIFKIFSKKLEELSRAVPNLHVVHEDATKLQSEIQDLVTKNSVMKSLVKQMLTNAVRTSSLSTYFASHGVRDEIIKIEDDAREDTREWAARASREIYLEYVHTTLDSVITRGPHDRLFDDLQELLERHPDYAPEDEDEGVAKMEL